MEFFFLKRAFEDKEVMNPMNPEEVFSCQDLINDYKVCKKEKRM